MIFGLIFLKLRDFVAHMTTHDRDLRPIIEPIRVVRKNNRQKDMDSSKIKIPTSTAPTAPMPVHTGYAVPKGNVCVAFANNTALKT